MNKNSRKYLIIAFLALGFTSIFLCNRKYYADTISEVFEPNASQNRLYHVWNLYYQDSIAAKKRQNSIQEDKTYSSVETDLQELMQLKKESVIENNFSITDSISKKGTWLYCKKNWYGQVDTLITLNINCILGKIEKGNHSVWIIKRVETTNKYTADFIVTVKPTIKYDFYGSNRILSNLYLQLFLHQGKTIPSMIFTVQRSNLGSDSKDNSTMFCLNYASEGIAWLGHKNVMISTFGEFFEICK
jgi:hypothetical protein